MLRKIYRAFKPTHYTKHIFDYTFTLRAESKRTRDDVDYAWQYALGRHASVIFDIGCSKGYDNLMLLPRPELKRAILVDANKEALVILTENLIRNNLMNKVNVVLGFVADKMNDTYKLWSDGAGHAGSMYRDHAKSATGFQEVQSLTIDFLRDFFKADPELIKIDIEGAEIMALNGAKETVKACKPKIFVEVHSNEGMTMEANTLQIIAWCNEMGYDCWYMKDKSLITDAEKNKHRGRCHVLLLPKGTSFPEYLKNIEQSAPIESVVI